MKNNENTIKSIYPDLSMHMVYLNGKTKTRYGWELQNTVGQIRFRSQYPMLDYEFAYKKLLEYANLEQINCDKITIYHTSLASRINQKPGKKLYQIVNSKVVYDFEPDWDVFKKSSYFTQKCEYIKKIIQEEEKFKNYYYYGRLEDFSQ